MKEEAAASRGVNERWIGYYMDMINHHNIVDNSIYKLITFIGAGGGELPMLIEKSMSYIGKYPIMHN